MHGQDGPSHNEDRYQLRAASASQPKTLKTYACARDCTPRRRARRCWPVPGLRDARHAAVIGAWSEAPVQFDATGWRPRSDYQTLSKSWRTVCFGLMRFLSTCARTLAVALHLLTSLHGPKRTSRHVCFCSAIRGQADIS